MRRWLGVLTFVLAGTAPAGAVTQESFQLRTGSDLVELCGVATDDPLQAEAIHMCHGFGVGTYQTIVAVSASDKIDDFFCPPATPLTRNEAFARFLVWAKQPENATYLGESPAALVGRYLITTYPCPKPATSGGVE